jgi:hypothetical protein
MGVECGGVNVEQSELKIAKKRLLSRLVEVWCRFRCAAVCDDIKRQSVCDVLRVGNRFVIPQRYVSVTLEESHCFGGIWMKRFSLCGSPQAVRIDHGRGCIKRTSVELSLMLRSCCDWCAAWLW